ncbi:histidine--tRNA ligase [candidate division WS5 bacterium]|uniref:Histidine--tRNA ligase n=1 Tax=candidate division WS5 bacterium TaxID=2093353 RepID=A0A419DF82_9BACT|nr:MAG: histidine--tRNA ligase [candidate division WS5 bacterium]
MGRKIIQKPRGTKDIFGEDQKYFKSLRDTFENVAEEAGFLRIDTPAFEDTKLFVRGVGKETEIVSKEMYAFKDKSGNSLTLRPEGTAPVVRAYIENGMQSFPQPVSLYYFGNFFRYERPQAGRYRELWQYGLEVIGDKNPLVDANIIATVARIYKRLDIQNITIQINSIGCPVCRPKYIKLLKKYYAGNLNKLCADCKKRYKNNPLRLLDCKNERCTVFQAEAPQIINNLCSACHDHFKTVLEYIDELEISYELNPGIVRGLDYYTGTVFEVWSEKDGAQNAIGGGGRYDELVQLLGGPKASAMGFAGGVERTVEEMKKEEIEPEKEKNVNIFVAQLGAKARKKCFKLLNDLLDAGIGAEARFDKGGIGEQLKIASKLGVDYTLLIGQREAFDGTVIIKDMASGNQEVFPYEKVVNVMQKRLGR